MATLSVLLFGIAVATAQDDIKVVVVNSDGFSKPTFVQGIPKHAKVTKVAPLAPGLQFGDGAFLCASRSVSAPEFGGDTLSVATCERLPDRLTYSRATVRKRNGATTIDSIFCADWLHERPVSRASNTHEVTMHIGRSLVRVGCDPLDPRQ